MKGTITKISDNKNALRTLSIEGEFGAMPEVGKQFVLVGQALDEEILEQGGFRCVSTSLIEEIVEQSDESILFKTINSLYRLDISQ